MTAYALTRIQPPAVIEAIRDGRPAYLNLPPTIVREFETDGKFYPVDNDEFWATVPEDRRRERTVSPTLPDQPCPECEGKGYTEGDHSYAIEQGIVTPACGGCDGSGRVLLPLLIPGEACYLTGQQWWVPPCDLPAQRLDLAVSVNGVMLGQRMEHWVGVAGLAVVDRPVPLPVVDAYDDTTEAPFPCVALFNGDICLFVGPGRFIAITDHFPTPPEPGGVVVDLSGARWLPEAVTEMLRRRVPPDGARRYDDVYESVPLSPGSGELTVVEVP